MALDLAPIMPWVAAVLSLLALGDRVFSWFSSGEKALGDRLAKAENTLIAHDRRIQSVEGELDHLPNKDVLHRFELLLEKMSGRIDVMDASLKPIAATTTRLQRLLEEQAK
ncbi:DUF2730 family protein [Rhizobium sp. CFBP 8762]|uniref:DUF2730 family protein n=1 Tax=Rhizobium sp. CFBP 8762 TaxID=2775279 RepID=UPI0017863A56|nr:DUF2730 family protein [Rhizobium sp. CFBP 8762]MBD8554904.1 DUF2730 family protein [Rhizobium sp. CFBP 8762]